ncbi:hypothetical protein PVAP13_8KG330300 [Panicum virgatum]|uniref:Uncharacterized protein n=1 Tax=Panicum virgatum TaxID=38727 RepID=A0A8T0PNL8_PANVG|nr:hypothetical protein PVAP13_8KG330300 [Panicum virgatum]
MASKSITSPALLVFLAMTLMIVASAKAQVLLQVPCPPPCKGDIDIRDVNVIELWRQRVRPEIVTVRVSTPHSAYLSCPPGCKGNIELTDINVHNAERWAERILAAIDDLQHNLDSAVRGAPVTPAAADVESVVADEKKKA